MLTSNSGARRTAPFDLGLRIAKTSLLICSALLYIFSESPTVFLGTSTLTGLLAAWLLWQCIQSPFAIRVFQLYGISILLSYALSSATSSLQMLIREDQSAASYFGYPQEQVSIALALTLASVWILLAIGSLEISTVFRQPKRNTRARRTELLIALISLLAVVIAIGTGRLGFMMLQLADTESRLISPLAALASLVLAPAGAFSVYCALISRKGAKRSAFLVCALLAMFILLTQGRRLAMNATVIYLIAALATGRFTLRTDLRGMLILAGAGLFTYIAFSFFYALRLASWEAGGADLGLISLVTHGLEILFDGEKYELFSQLDRNVMERPFIIGYLSELVGALPEARLLHGEVALSGALNSVPSVFIGEKLFLLDEELINPRFGLPVIDRADSAIVSGLADFGYAGALIYPAAMAGLLKVFLRFVQQRCNEQLSFLAGLSVVFCILNVESSPTSTFVMIRNSLLVGFVFMLMYKVNFENIGMGESGEKQ